jgi:hypothetical protein
VEDVDRGVVVVHGKRGVTAFAELAQELTFEIHGERGGFVEVGTQRFRGRTARLHGDGALTGGGHADGQWQHLKTQPGPDEGISLRFAAKTPGEGISVSNILMDMRYDETFGTAIADAYERLLLDAMRGDATLFARRDGVEAAWAFITPILEGWEADERPVPIYAPGSDGPKEAAELIARDGRRWRAL